MNVTGPIIRIIASNAAANNLLGGRVYPGVILQNAGYPCAAVNITGVQPNNSKTEASTLDVVRVQVDVYGVSMTSAAQAAAAIRSAIDYFTGTVNLTGGGTVIVKHIEYKGELSGFSEVPELCRIIQTYTYST